MSQPLLKEIIAEIENFAPPAFQEDYDNSGLQAGNPRMPVKGILIALDVTEAVLNEALDKEVNLIVAHHPLTLKGFKKLTPRTEPERVMMKAVKNDVAIYSAHTNLDSVENGVSGILATKLGLTKVKVLKPREGLLKKLVTFVPSEQAERVRESIFAAGAGVIGNYDSCSYNLTGHGSFRAGEDTNPFVGEKGKLHYEKEERVETILPAYLESKVLKALFDAHPYEEVAYDLYPLDNQWAQTGFGAIGELPAPVSEKKMLETLKNVTGSECVRHTALKDNPVKTIAVCGGSGSFLLNDAIAAGADIFVSADFKYHQFAEADDKIVIADIGHYESEQFTKEVFFELLTKKFPNFAVRLSNVSTNPIKYF
ncbi:MAG: Nif3-like dinuclear metal center hexameric protein [Marinilabilia sp.]